MFAVSLKRNLKKIHVQADVQNFKRYDDKLAKFSLILCESLRYFNP